MSRVGTSGGAIGGLAVDGAIVGSAAVDHVEHGNIFMGGQQDIIGETITVVAGPIAH